MNIRSGDMIPVSAFFSDDWEPTVPSDTPTVTIEMRNLSTGTWSTLVSAQPVTVLASGLCYYDISAGIGHYEYVISMTTTDPSVDQSTIVLDPIISGGPADDASSIYIDTQKILGLVHENVYIDNTTYDVNSNMTSARLRTYSNSASVGTASDVIETYTITAAGDGVGKFTSWKMIT